MISIIGAIGKAVAPVAANAAIEAVVAEIRAQPGDAQTKSLIDALNYAAAANQMVNSLSDLADPARSLELRQALERHVASMEGEEARARRLLDEARAAQSGA